MITGYAATKPGGKLKPFEFDPGFWETTKLRSKSSIAGYCFASTIVTRPQTFHIQMLSIISASLIRTI